MILFKNGLIILDYNPADDILSVELPDIQKLTLPEVRRSFQIIGENLRNYDVKYLLIDSSKAVVDIEDIDYKAVIMQFGSDLLRTRLQKLARVGGTIPKQEKRAQSVATETIQALDLPFKFANFENRESAIKWLLGKEQLAYY